MLGLKKKAIITKPSSDSVIDLNKAEDKNSDELLNSGMYSLRDLLAPTSVDRSNPDHIVIGKKYVRNFIMQGFPQQAYVTWLNDLYHYEGDMDTVIHIEPADDRKALDALTVKITQFETQLAIEQEKGNIRNLTRLRDTIVGLYEERSKIERNTEKLFQVQIGCNLFADSKEELDKETQYFDGKLRGRKIYMMPLYLRQDEGYKSVLPYGKSYVEDMFRNFNSGALTACFPFYNNEVFHENGVFCGVNLSTWTPVMIDFYDRKKLNNSNVTVIGQAGTGKTFFVSLLTMRSALRQVRTVIIDPEGEYRKLTEALGGSHILLAPDSDECINPFDIEESPIVDEDGLPIGGSEVLLKEKVADLLNLIAVMARGLHTGLQSTVSDILMKLYLDKGFSEDPKSLYITEPYFDKATKQLYHDGMKKPMPIFSDFWEKLYDYGKRENDEAIIHLANSLKMFKKGGIYDMFDTHTAEALTNFSNKPIVTFNVSKLEESILRPIGMYVAMSWAWEKFAKKNPHVKKRIVCDEAWMLVSKNMAGSEYTANFLETTARRIRKRNGGLLVASQNFSEFANNSQGQAVLKNAITNVFLGQDPTDADALKEVFRLSDGEVAFLMKAKRGEMLLRLHGESSAVLVIPFDKEKALIEKKQFVPEKI